MVWVGIGAVAVPWGSRGPAAEKGMGMSEEGSDRRRAGHPLRDVPGQGPSSCWSSCGPRRVGRRPPVSEKRWGLGC